MSEVSAAAALRSGVADSAESVTPPKEVDIPTTQAERSALTDEPVNPRIRWGHNGAGSAWHVFPETVLGEVSLGAATKSQARCDEWIDGGIAYADRPVPDNACLNCAALVGLELPPIDLTESSNGSAAPPAVGLSQHENPPQSAQSHGCTMGCDAPLPTKPKKPRLPRACIGRDTLSPSICGAMTTNRGALCDVCKTAPRSQRNQWRLDHAAARAAKKQATEVKP